MLKYLVKKKVGGCGLYNESLSLSSYGEGKVVSKMVS